MVFACLDFFIYFALCIILLYIELLLIKKFVSVSKNKKTILKKRLVSNSKKERERQIIDPSPIVNKLINESLHRTGSQIRY